MEIFKNVIGYNGIYQVSNIGRVRRKHKNEYKFLRGRIIYGYNYVYLCVENKVKGKRVHRLVCESFYGNKIGLQVNHKNGIKNDNRLENLEWCTASQNQLHSKQVLGRAKNENHYNAKLNWEQVHEIRIKFKNKRTLISLAKEYGVSKGAINGICYNKTWQQLKTTY